MMTVRSVPPAWQKAWKEEKSRLLVPNKKTGLDKLFVIYYMFK